jgi:hypothetical protein
MIIPTFSSVKFVEENGYLTSQMQLYNDELNTILRNGLSDNGWTIPEVTSAQLTSILALGTTSVGTLSQPQQVMPNGTIWYVSDKPPLTPLNELVVKMDDGTGTGYTLYKLTKTGYP